MGWPIAVVSSSAILHPAHRVERPQLGGGLAVQWAAGGETVIRLGVLDTEGPVIGLRVDNDQVVGGLDERIAAPGSAPTPA